MRKIWALRDKSLKIAAVLPAYNAFNTVQSFVDRFPFKLFDEVILVDDCSGDGTYKKAIKLLSERAIKKRLVETQGNYLKLEGIYNKPHTNLRIFRNSRNLGYGGNLKKCLGLALERGADVVVEIHPDGEYGFDGIEQAIKLLSYKAIELSSYQAIKRGSGTSRVPRGGEKEVGLVLGNRFAMGIPQGMYLWKVPFIKALNWIANLVLYTNVPDLHQGFRVYTKELLNEISYRNCSDNYIFSFQIIVQAVFKGIEIGSVPVSTNYVGKKRGASLRSSVAYSLGVLGILGQFMLAKVGLRSGVFRDSGEAEKCVICKRDFLVRKLYERDGFKVFWCGECFVGFTFPVPKDIQSYYPEGYWGGLGLFGRLRGFIFTMFQKRRIKWARENLPPGSKILDIGSGEGDFGKGLTDYEIISLEPIGSGVKNESVLKRDFLKFSPKEKFDGIVFWESLEHVEDPKEYLLKARSLLRPGGLIFVEYPVFDSLESRLFKESWFHLDLPRHLVHFSPKGLRLLAVASGFKVVEERDVWSPEYSIIGFFASLLASFGLADRFSVGIKMVYILFSPLLFVSFILEVFFYTINQSPIALLVIKKNGLSKN